MPKVYDPILCMMVDEPTKARDESYIVRGRKYKVVKRDGDNVTVIGPDGKVTKMHIDFLMSEGKKANDSASALDKATRTTDAANLKELKDDYGRLRNASSIIGNVDSLSSSTKSAILKAIESGMREIDTRIDLAYMK